MARGDNLIVMPLLFVLAAFAIIAILIVVGMRVRWNDGSRPGWEPEQPPYWQDQRPLPRYRRVLGATGLVVLVGGVLLGALTRQRWLGVASLVVYAVTWVIRNILIRWTYATSFPRRVGAVATPVTLVLGVVLTLATRTLWWFVAGATGYLAPSLVFGYADWRRRTSRSGEPRGNR